MGFSPFDNFMFNAVPVIVGIGFIVIIGLFISAAVKGGIQWNKNNNSPILTVVATVVAKRTNVSHHHYHGENMAMRHSPSSTK